MEKKVVSGIMFTLLMFGMLTLTFHIQPVKAEEQWIPYGPSQEQWWVREWSLIYRMENETSYVDVHLVWPDTGYNVSNWGTVVKEGHNIWVDTRMWKWTGYSLPVIVYESHTYDLGYLEAGNYTFTFNAWGFPVKSISFTVTHLIGDINNDGIVDIFDIGVISAHWYPGPPEGPLGYDLEADLNNDGNIDILDIGIISSHWGQSW